MLGKGGSCLLQIIGTIFTVLSKMSFSCQWFVGQQITRGISQTNSLSWISFVSACVWKDSFQGSPNMQNCAGFIRSIFSPWLSGLLVWIWMCAMISPNHYWPSERLGHWIIIRFFLVHNCLFALVTVSGTDYHSSQSMQAGWEKYTLNTIFLVALIIWIHKEQARGEGLNKWKEAEDSRVILFT